MMHEATTRTTRSLEDDVIQGPPRQAPTPAPTTTAPVLATGVREDALIDAIHVAALFNMIVRLADSFGWHVPPDREFAARAEASLGSSYALLTPSDAGS